MIFSKANYFLISSQINKVNKDNVFLFGLFAKLILVFSFNPTISSELFLPFIENILGNFTFDPWNNFLISGGDINSFPYGPVMLFAYLPLSLFGNLLDKYIYDFNFFEIGFRFTSLFFDYLLLIFLSLLTNNRSIRLLIICYWISPITIYTNFIHGQLDIVPISLLIGSVFFIKINKFSISGIILALSCSSKFSMLIALPFFIIYIYKRNGFQREIIRFLICFAAILSILFLPYLYSNGYWEMVLKTRETDRIYTVFISYGSSLKLYVLPVIYIFSLYLFWRLNRITQDLFLVSVGIGFISIIVFLPPAPGWTLWIIPFISYYQIISKKDIILICLIYNFIYLINTSSFTGTLNTGLLNIIGENNFPISSNMLFTIQQCLGLLLAIRMYIYGLKKNNLYSTSNKSILTILNGNYFENIHLLINSFQNLIYSKDLYISSSNSIINDKKLQKITNEDFILSKTGRQEGSKAIYYANYMSDNISKIEQNLTVNKKPYQFILNDSDIDLNLLITKINIKLNINRVSQNTSSSINYDEIKNNKIIFDFKLLNEKSKREIKQYSIITYFPLGFLHNKLFNLFISIASLNVDIELINNQKIVKMEIEGFPSREDVIEIARSLIPEVDDLSFNENGWSEGYIGIMQIIFIANLSTILKNKSFL